jgi:bifunctional DNA-binding transcriptional regulator/antitoxin component of YhaV-PrlF toxin-antitoxin module
MSTMSKSATLVIGKKGRAVIPAAIRAEAGLTEGTVASASVDDFGRVIIETPTSIAARIRKRARAANPTGASAVDLLIAERATDATMNDR